jgi:GDP-fucose transporter C1
VFIGFVLGSYGEMNFSVTGLVFGVFSSVFVALYGIYVKKQLQIVNNDQWVLLGYNTTIAIVLLFPLIVISGEYSDVVNSVTPISGGSRFWWIMIFSGITGFLINISVFLQIKYTTPLTNVISATAKACFQTLLAWIIYQNIITATNGIGILITLFGSGLYSYVRYKEMNR